MEHRGGRPRITAKERNGIAERLGRWYTKRYKSRQQFAAALGLSRSTVNGWFGKDKRAPDVGHLLLMARKVRMSLNHLLLDVGPETLGTSQSIATAAAAIRENLIAEVAAVGNWPSDKVDGVVPRDGNQLIQSLVEHYAAEVRQARRAVLIDDFQRFYKKHLRGGGEGLPLWKKPRGPKWRLSKRSMAEIIGEFHRIRTAKNRRWGLTPAEFRTIMRELESLHR